MSYRDRTIDAFRLKQRVNNCLCQYIAVFGTRLNSTSSHRNAKFWRFVNIALAKQYGGVQRLEVLTQGAQSKKRGF
jgi:hypothetical protein